jgi:hypothetical protein
MMMIKSELFQQAIRDRIKVRFYYNLCEEVMEPYFIFEELDGSKSLYGRSNAGTQRIMKFNFKKIANIRLLTSEHFIPIIPTSPMLN